MSPHLQGKCERGQRPKGVCGPNGWKFVGLEAFSFSFSILMLLLLLSIPEPSRSSSSNWLGNLLTTHLVFCLMAFACTVPIHTPLLCSTRASNYPLHAVTYISFPARQFEPSRHFLFTQNGLRIHQPGQPILPQDGSEWPFESSTSYSSPSIASPLRYRPLISPPSIPTRSQHLSLMTIYKHTADTILDSFFVNAPRRCAISPDNY